MTSKTLPATSVGSAFRTGDLSPWRAWTLVFLLLAAEFFLFRRYAIKEVIWAYPRIYDQAVYLQKSYETYDRMKHGGFWIGLKYGAGFDGGIASPNGALIHLEAAILFWLFGPGRLVALCLNFLHFCVFQLVLVAVVRALSRRWSAAFLALGLLLTTRTTFQETGGIMDFRIDFISFCLFGVFVCLVLRSRFFGNLRWTIGAALVASYTIAFRFITAAYLIAIAGIFCLVIASAIWRHRNDSALWRREFLRLRNLAMGLALAVLTAGPVLWHHWTAIANYYFRLHAAGPQRYIRAAGFKVINWGPRLYYYPQSVMLHHGGLVFVVLATAAFAVGLRRRPRAFFDCVAIAGVCFLVPLGILTWDVDKNAAVGDILVGPLLLLALSPWLVPLKSPGPQRNSKWHAVVAAISLSLGAGMQLYSYTRDSAASVHRGDIENVLGLYDKIWSVSRQNGWPSTAIASDSFSEFLFAPAINATTYERHQTLLGAHELLATDLLRVSDQRIDESFRLCDFALLTRNESRRGARTPFAQSLEESRDWIGNYCRNNLTPLTNTRAIGWNVTLYSRNPEKPVKKERGTGGKE